MKSTADKDFGPIREDYTFFEHHATEAEADLAGYLPICSGLANRFLAKAPDDGGPFRPFRLLDFGCGPGSFSSRFLGQLSFPPDRLQLFLVDPQSRYLKQAQRNLSAFTRKPIQAWERLPQSDQLPGLFDLILANHVLYYVNDLADVLLGLARTIAQDGVFLAAMAGQDNDLMQLTAFGFSLLGLPMPYHTAEEVEAVLRQHGVPFDRRSLSYHLSFPDTVENRTSIARFLLAEHLPQMPVEKILAWFNPFQNKSNIHMELDHYHFVIPRP